MKRSLPVLKPRQVLGALKRAGFVVHHVSGSHYILKHPEKLTLRVTLPFHAQDLKRRTLKSIVDQPGLTTDEFLKLL